MSGLVALITGAAALGAPLCPTAAVFAVPCPGCGLTRATMALLQGDVAGALHLHPLVFVLLPIYGLGFGALVFTYVRGSSQRINEAATARASGWVVSRAFTLGAAALLALVIGVWAARFFGAFGGPVPVERIAKLALTR